MDAHPVKKYYDGKFMTDTGNKIPTHLGDPP
jgi:hypothetical protein